MNFAEAHAQFRQLPLVDQVKEIRQLDAMRFTHEQIAALTGCCLADIERVISGRNMPL